MFPLKNLARKGLTRFPCICNLELPDISFGDLLRVEHRTSLFSCLCMSKLAQNCSSNMQNLGIWDVSMLHPPGKIYLVWGIGKMTIVTLNQTCSQFLSKLHRYVNIPSLGFCMHIVEQCIYAVPCF